MKPLISCILLRAAANDYLHFQCHFHKWVSNIDNSDQVWLAALRETEQQDFSEQHVICEDHFLPQDISTKGVSGDAIPIMPPHLDGLLGLVSPWGAESSEEEDAEEEEEEQWVAGDCEEEEERGNDAPPASHPPQQV